jgi:hypothetical protein
MLECCILLLFPISLAPSFYCRQQVIQDSTSIMGMSMWFTLLVPFFIMMVVFGHQNTSDDEEELEVGNTYHGEE